MGFENRPEGIQLAFGLRLVDGVDVNSGEEMFDAERFYFTLLQATKSGSDQEQFGGDLSEDVEVAVATHRLADFDLAESGETGRAHRRGKTVFVGDEVEGKAPTIGEGSTELVFGDLAARGGTNRVECRNEEVLSDLVGRREAAIQIENEGLDHAVEQSQLTRSPRINAGFTTKADSDQRIDLSIGSAQPCTELALAKLTRPWPKLLAGVRVVASKNKEKVRPHWRSLRGNPSDVKRSNASAERIYMMGTSRATNG